ncbi:MAG: bifunctional adenosylcobinamide kinase/adenosylcobinamide-phosphate guanylyltransferase [Deltaproteobacteria bacterium]|jgi:adenosylcobinamide kinase/adenosylcobinamide-phosphate guanylyltransferase|nr:bifunctional adenosylcobinamide kinase/adenosylcobinamide-phosphate guanylyltransferase [Deltaproteobacteria bacterium]
MGELILYLGGAKSGKTLAALAHTEKYPPPRYYLATAEPLDEEMVSRIANHRAERGPDWRTIEEPLDLVKGLELAGLEAPVLLDCLTIWLSNVIGLEPDSREVDSVMSRVDKLIKAAGARSGPVIMVSNEVGQGLVPMDSISRFFRDLSGLTHQKLAKAASSVFFVTAGISQKLK